MRFLRGIEKTTRRDRIREITRERLKVVSLQETMEGRRIQWMGHVKRMRDNRMPRIALEKEEGGRRPRGRPRGRWEDQVWKDIERRGLQKIQVDEEETWNDRLKWRRLCTTTLELHQSSSEMESAFDKSTSPGQRLSQHS
ncbi:hypothetical protein J6590_075364 [Homalodisca vitripennis]|nr:hypothetical protein J6590_075364 [Homalodisca vitripennis]